MRAALISNPHSARNRRHLGDIDAQLRGRVIHRITQDMGDLSRIVAELADAGVDFIGINGGDGTVHQVLTHMQAIGALATPPRLALLPGGSTNMTSRDINGLTLSLPQGVSAFLRAVDGNAAVTQRKAIRIARGSSPAQIGFCFGMGAIIRGIEFCHERIFSLGIRREWASGAALVRAAWGIARREAVFSEGIDLTASWDNESRQGRSSIFLVSTLDHLFLGIRPFWGTGSGTLSSTWVDENAHRFFRTLPALLRGDADRLHEEDGYTSRRAESVEVSGGAQYTIDGDIYANDFGHLRIDSTVALDIAKLGRSS